MDSVFAHDTTRSLIIDTNVVSNAPTITLNPAPARSDTPLALHLPTIASSPSLTSFPRSPSLNRVSNKRRPVESIAPIVFSAPAIQSPDPSDAIESPSSFGPVGNSSVTARRRGRASAAVSALRIREIAEEQWSGSSRSSPPPSSSEAFASRLSSDELEGGKPWHLDHVHAEQTGE